MEQRAFRSIPDKGRVGCPRRPEARETVHGLEQICLALGIAPDDEVHALRQFEVRAPIVAEILDIEALDSHFKIRLQGSGSGDPDGHQQIGEVRVVLAAQDGGFETVAGLEDHALDPRSPIPRR